MGNTETSNSGVDWNSLKFFCRTHEMKYYDSLPQSYKKIFETEIQKLKVPTAVSTIIKNHLNYDPDKFPHIGRVQGPASMYKLKWIFTDSSSMTCLSKPSCDMKIIYLFGQRPAHSKTLNYHFLKIKKHVKYKFHIK